MENKNNKADSLVGTSKSADSPCSLSWFLVKNDGASAAKHGKYAIVHAMQLTTQDPNDVFVSMDTEHRIGKEKVRGKVLSGSQEIQFVKEEMQKWINLDHINENRSKHFCLVQCRPTPYYVFYKVIHRDDVTPVTSGPEEMSCEDVFIKYGTKVYQGLVLMNNKSWDEIQMELWKLRNKTHEIIYSSFLYVISPSIDIAN